jgi:hypothetical protein
VRRTKILIVLALALIAVALTLAGCGGGGDVETTTATTPSESPSGSTAPPSLSAFPPEFLDCLAGQGIDLESVTDVSAVIHSPEGEQCFDVLHGG